MMPFLPDMTAAFLLAQVFAVIGVVLCIIGPQFKSERHLLMAQIPEGALWAIHFVLMGGFTGAAVNVVNMLRTATSLYLPKKYHTIAVIAAVIASIIASHLTWSGWHCALPAFAAIFSGYAAMSAHRASTMRFCVMMSGCCWIYYDLSIHAYLSAACSIFMVISGVIGLYRKHRYTSGALAMQPAE